jgi:hypothetical protein
LPSASDGAVLQFATALSVLLGRLQDANPEACWAFAHEGPNDPHNTLPQPVLDAVAMARRSLSEAARPARVARPDAEERKKMTVELVRTMRMQGKDAVLQGLRAGAAHATFCPSFQELLDAALALPDLNQVPTLRALLADE